MGLGIDSASSKTAVDCEEAELLISRRVDGEIDPIDVPLLQAHLDQCGNCRSIAQHWSAQSDLMTHGLKSAFPPQDHRRGVEKPASRVVSRALAGAAFFLCILFFAGTAQAPRRTEFSGNDKSIETVQPIHTGKTVQPNKKAGLPTEEAALQK